MMMNISVPSHTGEFYIGIWNLDLSTFSADCNDVHRATLESFTLRSSMYEDLYEDYYSNDGEEYDNGHLENMVETSCLSSAEQPSL